MAINERSLHPLPDDGAAAMTMRRVRWNRSVKRDLSKKDPPPQEPGYKVSRVKPRKRKPKHAGYTIISPNHFWMFENKKITGAN